MRGDSLIELSVNGQGGLTVKDEVNLKTHLWAGNTAREVNTEGRSLILYRCPGCDREFAREPGQSAGGLCEWAHFGLIFSTMR
jgi:hypothetical protein